MFMTVVWLSLIIPALSKESSGILLLPCSVRPSVCHVLLSQTALTSYKPANWTLGVWFGVSCCFVKRFQKFSVSPGGQIIGKKWRFFTKNLLPRTPPTFSTVDKSSFGICFRVSYRCAIRFRNFQFCPGGHLMAKKWRFFTKKLV